MLFIGLPRKFPLNFSFPKAEPHKPERTLRLEAVAHQVDAGTGLKMLAAQASNEVLRRCRIGRIVEKAAVPQQLSD